MLAGSLIAFSLLDIPNYAMLGLPLLGCVCLAYAIFNLVTDLRKVDAKRVTKRLKEADNAFDNSNEQFAKESILRRQLQQTSPVAQFLSKFHMVTRLQRNLEKANIAWSATAFLINVVGITAAAYIACYFLNTAKWILIAAVVVAFFAPPIVIWFLARRRMNKFINQLPDVFELMSQALRAGHSLANAILLISQQLPDPVGTEFARVFHEQNLGIKLDDSLKDLANRIDIMDVRFFVTAVLIQRQTGGDLAEVLDNISGVIRERIKLFGTVRALTAEGRLSGYVLLALPIVVFLVEMVLNPSYASVMIDEPLGQYMLIGAGVSQLLGLALIQKIINIKV